jgi:hypothetical protein
MPPKRNRGTLIVISLVLTLVLLGLGGWAAWITLGPPANNGGHGNPNLAATISITPASKTVQDTYVMQGVTGNSNADNRQVSVRQLTSTKTATDTVNATGHKQMPGVAATGTLMFTNGHTTAYTVPGGTTINAPNGIAVATDKSLIIPGIGSLVGNQASVAAHAVNPGVAGNIAALAINQTCTCDATGNVLVQNSAAFTGGQDGRNYSFLQQSDITAVTDAHETKLKSNAQNDIKGQVKSGEQLLSDSTCDNAKTTADQPIGDRGVNVTTARVTVSVTCNAKVYDANAVQTIAQNALKQKANVDPGTGYVLAGRIVTQAQQPQVQQDGTVSFPVTASGVWYYQWTDANKQALLDAVKGKSQEQAQTTLNSYQGVGNAKIDISNGATTLPSDPNQITLDVKTVNGL